VAKLAEGLEIQVSADISDFKRGMRDVKKETAGVTSEVAKAGDAADKASAKGARGFKAWRSEVMFLRSNVLLVSAALVAVATPILKADDAMSKLKGTATLFGRDGTAVLTNIKSQADALKVSYADASAAAQAAIVGGQNVKTAVSDMKLALNLSGMGLGSKEAIDSALGGVAKAFSLTKAEAADLGVQAAKLGADFVSTLQSATQLRPAMEAVGLSFASFSEAMAGLQSRGASPQESLAVITELISTVRQPTEEAKAAFDKFGIPLNELTLRGEGLATVLAMLTQGLKSFPADVQAALGGSQQLADILGGIGSPSTFQSNAGSIAAGFGMIAEAATQGKSAIDSLNDTLNTISNTLTTIIGPLETATKYVSNFINMFKLVPMALEGLDQMAFGDGTKSVVQNLFGNGFATGGMVPGSGVGDTVPAMLTPGEYVIRKDVAAKMMPFLAKLNAGGFDPSTLWNLPIAGRKIGKERLLDILGIPQKFGISSGSVNINDPNLSDKQAELSRLNFQMLRALQGYANGGPVTTNNNHNSSIGTVNMQVSGADIETPSGRRRVFQSIARESAAGRKAIGRSRA